MLIIFLSLLPCLFWLVFFYIQDWYDREPLWLVGTSFLLGILSTIPALLFNTIGGILVMAFLGNTIIGHLCLFFGVVGPVEEGVKMLAILIFAYRQPQFDEPVDGIIYSAAAALGFAASENVLYVSRFSISVLVLRGPLANAGHALFSAFWGLALSRAKASPNLGGKRAKIIILGWLTAACIHGLYDFSLTLMSNMPKIVMLAPILLLTGGMFIYVEYKVLGMVANSPNRPTTKKLRAMLRCPNCGHLGKASTICRSCRMRLPSMDMGEWRYCNYCGALSDPGSINCSHCQASLLSFGGARPATSYPHFIKILPNGQEEVAFVIREGSINIGQTLDNDFVIDDESVSRSHARIVMHPSGIHVLQDLGSMNGTFVNGLRITENYLQNGFEARFGQARFIYRAMNFMQV
jgi:RsiW-degrading membrane proteinase PrsW (M82 family)